MNRNRTNTALRVLAMVAVVLLAGCWTSGSRGADQNPFVSNDWDGPVLIEVQNRHFNDARIYAIWESAGRRRIGTVTGTTTQTIETEWRGDQLRVQVDLIGAGGFTTGPIGVWPGETLVLQIPSN